MSARAYAAAKAMYDRAPRRDALPDSVWIDRVKVIDFELAQEAHGQPDD